ncbi:MAG: helix-turn-helix transcriptional regulator, partial [Ilumatobacteraceae bacterium]
DVAACVELLRPLDDAEFRAGNGGVGAAALDRLRAAIAAQQAWDLLVDLGWVHLSHAGRDQSVTELDTAHAALAPIPPDAVAPRHEALRELLSMYRGLGIVTGSAGDRVEFFLAAADRWASHPDVSHRHLLLAFDAATLSGDPALTARCQERHRRMEAATGEPPTWRVPMVEGFRSIAEGRLGERPADLRLYGAASRSRGLDVVLSALALRYTDGPEAAIALLDAPEEPSPSVAGDRTATLYRVYGALMLAIGTAGETRAAGAVHALVGDDRVLAPVAGFVFGGAAALARGLAGDASERAAAIEELDTMGAGRWLPSAWACVVRARHAASPDDQVAELTRAADILDRLGRRLEAAERVIDAAEIDLDRCGRDRLTSALETARAAGAGWLVARSVALAPSEAAPGAARAADGPLTARELEVAELLTDGLTNREIAGRLYISIRTVTSHLDHIYTKLGLSSRVDLAAWFRSQQ